MRTPALPVVRQNFIPVTVVIPVKNEERNLPSCLKRLKDFSEVWVVDSQSTDRTCEIAAIYGARIIDFVWSGAFPKKRNWVLLNERFATPWVLFLDADEQVSPAFVQELRSTLLSTDKVGFWINYTNYFLGRELRHGVPQCKLALFRVGAGLYERIDEQAWSGLDMEIHEHPVLDGPIGEIRGRIDHRDFRGLDKFLLRHVDYAKWEAARFEALRSTGTESWQPLTTRQRFKYRHLASWWFPWFYFLVTYVARAGFLDGRPGILYAYYKAWYFETIRALLIERRLVLERPAKS